MRPQKRGRGRPKGSSRHNAQDKYTLEMMADRMVRDRRLAATTAMRHLGYSDEASLRRLQRKWSREKSDLLARAHENYRQEQALEAQRRSENALAQLTDQMTAMQRAFESSGLSRIAAESARMQRLIANNPALESISRMQMQSERLARQLVPTMPDFGTHARAMQRIADAFATKINTTFAASLRAAKLFRDNRG
ncbi:MAG: hypothetical protein Q8P46_00685 [Hyphomicrobiales bacterium]|nr:hypothetical protein [Hyphomicrobiales bacterium]